MTTYRISGINTESDSLDLISLFQRQTAHQEQSARVFFENKILTYEQLNIDSQAVAHFLTKHQLPAEALVCVLMSRSIDAILAQLGILKAGGAYLPISPENFPLERICTIFEDAQVKFMVTTKQYQHLCPAIEDKLGRSLICCVLDDTDKALVDTDKISSNMSRTRYDIQRKQTHPDRLAYVMYTSGSTGKPKGVMITHQNIIRSVTDTDYFTLEKDDAFLHAAPISFDAATFEIWAALLNGKDLYIVPDKIVHQFEAFSDFVSSRPVTIAWLTSALFNLLAEARPTFFQSFRQILVGGEALSPRHINDIRKRYPELVIRNNYGPTENTIFSTSFLIDKDYQTNIPIGRAIQHKRAYILDTNLQRVAPGRDGELYVAGDGISPGYLNRPRETQLRFLPDPFFPKEIMYATGDICRYNEQGDIEFLGRQDKQVKVSGHRIELGEIEMVLHTCPQVKLAVVLYKNINACLKGLVAYIQAEQIDEGLIRKQLSAKLPNYMIPVYFEAISEIPLTVNGKIDRNAMQAWPLKLNSQMTTLKQDIESTVMAACMKILNLTSIDLSRSFFAQGGDSLSGTSLILELEQALEITLPLLTLYENPRIEDLIKAIQQMLAPEHPLAVHNAKPSTALESISLSDEATLHGAIRCAGRSVHSCPDLKGARTQMFLTGATGFFGAFLLKELLDTTSGRIHCLIRAHDHHHAKQRILETFRKYKIPVSTRQIERINGVPGDLCQANLGLSTEQFSYFTQNMDVIFHNGASVNYVDTYATLKGPNVIGTHEILKFASHARLIPVHYISSVSVFETLGFFTGKEIIFENDSVDISEHYVRLGYSQSKWVAEKMMENARSAGLAINIYRSGYIMGHSETGVSNTTDHIARYIAGCIEMGCAPILEEYASLSPVDQVSQAFCHIALNCESHGQTYHLCNPEFTTVEEIYQKIQQSGFPLELMPYAQWKEKLKAQPSSNPLYPLLSLHIHHAPGHALTLPELYERNTRFECNHFLTALEGSGIRINLDVPNLFERWLEYYLKTGLISQDTFNQTHAMKRIA